MIFRNANKAIGAIAAMFVLHGAASAATVGAGLFNLSGSVYVTNTSFLFSLNTPPTATNADETAAVILPSTGPFADLAPPQTAVMHNLLTPGNGGPFGPGPVIPGADFVLSPFLELPNGINADLTGLPVNFSVPVCSGTSSDNVNGFICRATVGSPVLLEQGSEGVTALLNLQGRAYYAGDTDYTPLTGKFSANFSSLGADGTISSLLADFTANGFITTSFSVNFATTPQTAVPEPASLALLGAGLFGLGLLGKKKLAR